MVLTNQLIYLVNVKTMRKIFSNYVCFSESLNFTDELDWLSAMDLCMALINMYVSYRAQISISVV